MRILNFGSLNVDHVYAVPHIVRPGETLTTAGYRTCAGGKGFNQSISLARAGAAVSHVGKYGPDGEWLVELLRFNRVDTTFLSRVESPTGHAIIQVDQQHGQNAILVHPGANHCLNEGDVEQAIAAASSNDTLLLQNEINLVPTIIERGADRGLRVIFNPSPFVPEVQDYPLNRVGLFILNEIEAAELTGEREPSGIEAVMRHRFPDAAVVLTLGDKGAIYFDSQDRVSQVAFSVEPVDTTAAGDTFTGFFLAELIRTNDPARALKAGCRAASVCVTRPGAADSIPTREECVESD